MKTWRLLAALGVLLCVGSVRAQSSIDELLRDPLPDAPNLMREEVLRRGTMVERLGDTRASDAVAYAAAALATPPDDSHKWYLSLVSTDNCAACERLKRDFAQHPDLSGWVNVSQPEHSWAHYNVYRYDDESQRFRFKDMRIKGFPTLIIQPPRNRQYGDPRTIVMQKTGYDGNAAKLNREMGDAIKRYVAKLQERGELRASGSQASALEKIKQFGGRREADRPDRAVGLRVPYNFRPPIEIYKTSDGPPAEPVAATASATEAPQEATKPVEHGAKQPPDLDALSRVQPPVEGPPPFLVNPRDPKQPDPNVDVPPLLDPDAVKPVGPLVPGLDPTGPAATYDELLRAFPDAEDGLLRKAVAAGKSLAQVQSEIEAMQRRAQIVSWIAGGTVLVLVIMGGGIVALLLGIWFVMWLSNRNRTPSGIPASSTAAAPSPIPAPSPTPSHAPTVAAPAPRPTTPTPTSPPAPAGSPAQ